MSVNKEFYSSTLNGVELKVKFAFPKVYFTKNHEDVNKKVYYDIGVLADIGWETSTSATPQHVLNMIKAMDITSGLSMTQGNMTFKTFHHESIGKLKEEILKGINEGRDKIEFPLIEDSPFIVLDGEVVDDIKPFETHSESGKVNWAQMPLFDIILMSQVSKGYNDKKVMVKEIRAVKITSNGFAESVESLEMNTFSSFMSIGQVTDWKGVNANE
ncbi:MAG: hypothetical protein ACRCXX_14160 [Cetobacterium sp.]|uniref:hypothetical protein n=1 Tax=Cetobacterium sp. TaxID=2071632 RepID=UPI003F3C5659